MLLKSHDLALAYEGVTVLRDLSFTVEAGDYLCILGENGSGKSSLMKAMLGLKKPQHGRIELDPGLHKGSIGYLPQQNPAQRDFPASVQEVVLSGCLNRSGIRPWYTRAQKRQARDNMALLDILPLRKASFRALSGGQQQRVLLARALCAADKLLLLDEPASGLDPHISQALYALIEHLHRSGMTIIMISHDVRAAARYATKVLHLAGKPLFFGAREDYLKSDIGRLYLGKEALL